MDWPGLFPANNMVGGNFSDEPTCRREKSEQDFPEQCEEVHYVVSTGR